MVRIALMTVNAVLAAAVVYFSVGMYRTAVEDPARPVAAVAPPQRNAAPAAGAARPASNAVAITRRNLLNTDQGEANTPPAPVALEGLKPTRLQLTLLGTVTDDADWAYAVIEDRKTRRQQLYRAGDPIQNAVVRMILADRVVLSVDGGNEILEMEKATSGGGGSLAARPAVSRQHPSPGGAPRPRTLPRALIERAAGDPDGLMDGAAMAPGMDGDTVIGIQLKTIQPSSILRRMGLQNGDIVTAVNDSAVIGVEDVLRFAEELADSETASIQIKRRDRNETITYTIR